LVTAKEYVASGEYFWNSGIFVFQAKTFLQELQNFEPDMVAICQQAFEQATSDLDFVRIPAEIFTQCPSESIDYAIMEKTTLGIVVPFDSHWSDLGSWTSLWESSAKDTNNNVKVGDVIDIDCKNSLIYAENHLIAAVGIDDLIIVDTKDALLIASKHRAQDVKQIVERLGANDREEHLLHREVHRPWGSYDSVDNGQRYQVKRITVKPGKSLSLQMHHHRAEHWVIVSGTALVQLGDDKKVLSEDQSIYIPLGTVHRLTNPGKVDLHIIEVQTGTYLGEDDIVRLEDTFGRN
jgi:mannose-1-phosphate guanylyltransferase